MARMSRYRQTQMENTIGCLAVCFFPGKAYPFFSLPMTELSDQVIGLERVSPAFNEIHDRIQAAPATIEKVALLQQYLASQLKHLGGKDETTDYCINRIHDSRGKLRIEDLATETGISNRQLIRRFLQRVGVTPKEFTCTTRFVNALQILKKFPALNLTEIAFESGYYDQAHFIHDVKHYSGVTPGQLVNAENILF